MKIIHLLILSTVIVAFSSCLKSDTPITLPPAGGGTVMQVDMGETYNQQFFVNLSAQKIVHVSDNRTWDLQFQCDPNQHGIFVNEANQIGVYKTSKTNFEVVTAEDTVKISSLFKVDQASGELDSTAFGDWKSNNSVFIIRLNKNATKVCKVQIMSESALEYKIKIGNINEIEGNEIIIPKLPNQNHTYFSCTHRSIVQNVEPLDKTNWDLQFCVYNFTFYDQNPPLPYTVTGIFINPTNTLAYKDSLMNYANITSSSANNLIFSSQRDAIGYDWKTYDQNNSLYSVVKKYNYFIRNQHNSLFKLRFLDFYSTTGIKGSPKFEFQQIN